MSSSQFFPAVLAPAPVHHAQRAKPAPRRPSPGALVAISWLAPALQVLIWKRLARAGQVSAALISAGAAALLPAHAQGSARRKSSRTTGTVRLAWGCGAVPLPAQVALKDHLAYL
ncbi:hypothetical protein [Pantoea sp. 18069]|uniref:hypothetical protein n=1 Tax=Pantoea sp. 18069 TaxID=2681415 RepID=UPI00135A3D36|nr:hypothetical protein [Pantoea sp. 18069]